MSLTNRFSTLLLVTLGLTLVGFSTALFVLTRDLPRPPGSTIG